MRGRTLSHSGNWERAADPLPQGVVGASAGTRQPGEKLSGLLRRVDGALLLSLPLPPPSGRNHQKRLKSEPEGQGVSSLFGSIHMVGGTELKTGLSPQDTHSPA